MRRTLTAEHRVLSLAEMRNRNAPLREVIEAFFRANYDLSPKTERWYQQNLRGFVAFMSSRAASCDRAGATPSRL